MDMRCFSLALLAAVAVQTGCRRPEPARGSEPAPMTSPPAAAPATPAASLGDTLASVHWLGKQRIAADTNAAVLMGVWNLPESARLERQTLDKLSLAPWRLRRGAAAVSNAPAALVRPLLDDLLQQEFYLEVRQATNQPGQLAFAIRLNDERAALWKTNLALVLQSLTGVLPTWSKQHQDWSLAKHQIPNLIQLTRANGWTLLGAAQDHNDLLDDMLGRIRQTRLPFPAPITNSWLSTAVALKRVAAAFSLPWNLPEDLPKISFDVVADGKNVWTYGDLYFSAPLAMELEPWNIPTNLIDQPLLSFTAIRGVRPWLAAAQAWSSLAIGPPPDQLFFWALQGSLMHTFFAAPLPDASNAVHRLSEVVLQKSEPWFASHDLATLERSETYNGLAWKGVPYLWPFLQSHVTTNGAFVFGGFIPNEPSEPFSPDSLQDLLRQTNVVVHDWEITGRRIEQWIYIGQFIRFVSRQAQLPPDTAGQSWLRAAAPRLGSCVTQVTRTGPAQLSFNRKSTIGFTAIELNLLVDWLESPTFPIGLYSLLPAPEGEIAPAAPPPKAAR
jgi:hypothetical protein